MKRSLVGYGGFCVLLCLAACGQTLPAPAGVFAATDKGGVAKVGGERAGGAVEDRPTLITLHVKDRPLEEVLVEVSKQAGIEVRLPIERPRPKKDGLLPGFRDVPPLPPPPHPHVTIDVDRQPFWMVMREICRQTKWVPERTDAHEQITLVPAGHDVGPSFADRAVLTNRGCFMVTVVAVEKGQVFMQLYVDPKLRVLDCPREEAFDRADDERGRSLLRPPLSTTHTKFHNEGALLWSVYAPLQLDLKGAKRLADLHGQITLTVLEESQRWEILKPLEAEKSAIGVKGTGIELTFEGMKRANPDWEIRLKFSVTGSAEDKKSHPAFNYSALDECVHVLDAQGQPFDHYNGHDEGGDAANNHFDFVFDANNQLDTHAVPQRMALDIPTKVRAVVVPVEFKDLVLPDGDSRSNE